MMNGFGDFLLKNFQSNLEPDEIRIFDLKNPGNKVRAQILERAQNNLDIRKLENHHLHNNFNEKVRLKQSRNYLGLNLKSKDKISSHLKKNETLFELNPKGPSKSNEIKSQFNLGFYKPKYIETSNSFNQKDDLKSSINRRDSKITIKMRPNGLGNVIPSEKKIEHHQYPNFSKSNFLNIQNTKENIVNFNKFNHTSLVPNRFDDKMIKNKKNQPLGTSFHNITANPIFLSESKENQYFEINSLNENSTKGSKKINSDITKYKIGFSKSADQETKGYLKKCSKVFKKNPEFDKNNPNYRSNKKRSKNVSENEIYEEINKIISSSDINSMDNLSDNDHLVMFQNCLNSLTDKNNLKNRQKLLNSWGKMVKKASKDPEILKKWIVSKVGKENQNPQSKVNNISKQKLVHATPNLRRPSIKPKKLKPPSNDETSEIKSEENLISSCSSSPKSDGEIVKNLFSYLNKYSDDGFTIKLIKPKVSKSSALDSFTNPMNINASNCKEIQSNLKNNVLSSKTESNFDSIPQIEQAAKENGKKSKVPYYFKCCINQKTNSMVNFPNNIIINKIDSKIPNGNNSRVHDLVLKFDSISKVNVENSIHSQSKHCNKDSKDDTTFNPNRKNPIVSQSFVNNNKSIYNSSISGYSLNEPMMKDNLKKKISHRLNINKDHIKNRYNESINTIPIQYDDIDTKAYMVKSGLIQNSTVSLRKNDMSRNGLNISSSESSVESDYHNNRDYIYNYGFDDESSYSKSSKLKSLENRRLEDDSTSSPFPQEIKFKFLPPADKNEPILRKITSLKPNKNEDYANKSDKSQTQSTISSHRYMIHNRIHQFQNEKILSNMNKICFNTSCNSDPNMNMFYFSNDNQSQSSASIRHRTQKFFKGVCKRLNLTNRTKQNFFCQTTANINLKNDENLGIRSNPFYSDINNYY